MHYRLLQRSLLLGLHPAAQQTPNSIMVKKELNVALRPKEQGDDTLLPAFKGMRLIN